MSKPRSKAPPDDVSLPAESRHDAPRADPENLNGINDSIRARAYELYLERRDAPGDDVADWLRAEQEIREQRGATPANGEDRRAANAL
jgi:hypothetical protein